MSDRVFKTFFIMITAGAIWMLLELVSYGEVQPRSVDHAMMAFFTPFVYNSFRE